MLCRNGSYFIRFFLNLDLFLAKKNLKENTIEMDFPTTCVQLKISQNNCKLVMKASSLHELLNVTFAGLSDKFRIQVRSCNNQLLKRVNAVVIYESIPG